MEQGLFWVAHEDDVFVPASLKSDNGAAGCTFEYLASDAEPDALPTELTVATLLADHERVQPSSMQAPEIDNLVNLVRTQCVHLSVCVCVWCVVYMFVS
jgi:hypothetical protein